MIQPFATAASRGVLALPVSMRARVGPLGWSAAAVALLMIVAGCSKEAPPAREVERPVKTMVVVDGGELRTRIFPGRVEAAKQVELAFQVGGLLVELPVKEGQRLKRGDVIARLRPDEFEARLNALRGQLDQANAVLTAQLSGERPEQILRLESAVRAAEAQLTRAAAQFERMNTLIQTNAVSRAEFEKAESDYRVAREELSAAQQLLEAGSVARQEDIEAQRAVVRGLEGRVVEAYLQLQDTTLRAPYDGVVAEVFVRENQSISPKARVLRFQDVDEIEIAVDVPEAVMTSDVRTADIVELLAEFSGIRGVRFPVHIREIAQTADPVTQTFRIRVAMLAPESFTLLPGMTATVEVTYRRAAILASGPLVPITSIFKTSSGQQVAWVIGPDQTVSSRPVKLGEVRGGSVEVLEGVRPGERIAIAGVSFLRDGMKVRDLGNALGGSQ